MTTNNKQKIEDQRFEFVLYINKHIICQRYFSVRGFNEKSLRSIELKELMDRLVGTNNVGSLGLIPNDLKIKSIDYLWSYYNPYGEPYESPLKDNFEKEDIFDFEIRLDRRVIAQSTFSGNFFPTQVRYQVDIKDLIPNIISEIKDTLSQKKYVHQYGDVEL